jgi:cystinosin
MIGYCKILATCYKYLPQVRWNYIRKTTKGWSIFNVLMDLTGGIFSFSEIILRGAFIDSYQINISKFLLGTLTIVYDVVFLFQHYYFYPNKEVIPMPQSTSITMDSPSQNNQLGLEI